jgi:hypothetical protein
MVSLSLILVDGSAAEGDREHISRGCSMVMLGTQRLVSGRDAMQQLMEAEDLKEHCLEVLEQVSEQHETLLITRDGLAVAKLVSVTWTQEEAEDRSGRISVDDVVVPMEVAWES